MYKAIREVAPEDAKRLENTDASIATIKRFIYNYNYQVRAKFDSKVQTATEK